MAQPTAPTVFIHYCSTPKRDADRVGELSRWLKRDGIEVIIDLDYPHGPETTWPEWMWDEIERADGVLMVCTKAYSEAVANQKPPRKKKGARFEFRKIILPELYYHEQAGGRFIPIIFHRKDEQFIPTPLRGGSHYLYPGQYDELISRIKALKPKVRPAVRDEDRREVFRRLRADRPREALTYFQRRIIGLVKKGPRTLEEVADFLGVSDFMAQKEIEQLLAKDLLAWSEDSSRVKIKV